MATLDQFIKLLRPQDGDIIIADFNKVNLTQLEQALAKEGVDVPAIGVHNIETIKLFGLREQQDFNHELTVTKQELENSQKEVQRLTKIIQNEMVPKATLGHQTITNSGINPIPEVRNTASSIPQVSGINIANK